MDIPEDELLKKRNFDTFNSSSPSSNECPISHSIKKPKLETFDESIDIGFSSSNESSNMQSLANGNEPLNIDTVMPLNGNSANIHPLTNVEDGYNVNGADNLAQSDDDSNEFSPDIKEEIVDDDNE
jgi:hypothetical protein